MKGKRKAGTFKPFALITCMNNLTILNNINTTTTWYSRSSLPNEQLHCYELFSQYTFCYNLCVLITQIFILISFQDFPMVLWFPFDAFSTCFQMFEFPLTHICLMIDFHFQSLWSIVGLISIFLLLWRFFFCVCALVCGLSCRISQVHWRRMCTKNFNLLLINVPFLKYRWKEIKLWAETNEMEIKIKIIQRSMKSSTGYLKEKTKLKLENIG